MGEDSDSINSLKRTISVENIVPKLTSVFKKRKRAHTDVSDILLEEEHVKVEGVKKRKIKTQAEEDFDKQEIEYDNELPEEYRKYRPRGFRFNIPPIDRPIRIYADGVFDLFHLGHMKQLEQAKKSFKNVELVCGIPSDIETHKRKGLTVLSDKQRCETLMHCRWVDEVIPNAPWCVTPEFLVEHKIDYVAHDDLPYALGDSDDIYRPIKVMGKFLTTQRTDGILTSDIITKIIRDYDKYLMRNFARGATRKELNVSWLKKNELEIKKQFKDFRTYVLKNKENFNNVSKDLYFEVREYMKRSRRSPNSSAASSLRESTPSISDSEDSRSPLFEFASKYVGNDNKEMNKRSILSNVKDWIKGDELEYSTNDESEPELKIPVRKPRKKSSQLSDP